MALDPGHHEAPATGLTRLRLAECPPSPPDERDLVVVMEVIASRLGTTVRCMKIACVLLVLAVAGHVLRLAGI